jgi:hypothetical protein
MMRLVALSPGTLPATAGNIKEMVPWNARGLGRNDGYDITHRSRRPCITP